LYLLSKNSFLLIFVNIYLKQNNDMSKIKNFNQYITEEYGGGGAPAPSRPAPTTVPTTKPDKAPTRPSPIRRDKPSVHPPPKASAKDLVKRFLAEKDEDINLEKIYKNRKK
jgi:hypothetical protein